MTEKTFQDHYPEYFAHCYSFGSMNELGRQIKSHWDGDESVAYFQPKPYHTAISGYVYDGLLASLIDCHGTGTAAAAGCRTENRETDSEPYLCYLTASLHVDYLKPTPLGPTLEVRGKVKEVKDRKVVVEEWIMANGVVTVKGKLVAVQVSASLVKKLLGRDCSRI
jgi:acyl-coenzyme A thioesterase PaaI-like protein